MNIDLLSERLAKRDEISHEFVSINGNWQRGHFLSTAGIRSVAP